MWQKDLELAKRVAQAAGKRLERGHTAEQQVLDDRGRDVKLVADRLSEQLIVRSLREATPYGIVSEESGVQGAISQEAPIWIVDPLDGTLNYGRKLPLYCVSIGLWQGERPILGVIYDVAHAELFSGLVGEGAWSNGQGIHCSQVAVPAQAVLATGFPVNRDFESEPLQRFLRYVQVFKKVRLLGSAALSLAYLAAGRIDAYAEEDIMLWDVAAGVAIVSAAGGWNSVTTTRRHEWARNVFCAASPDLFAEQRS
jgi:myo-inositol-1(or 4)-monophosphatase